MAPEQLLQKSYSFSVDWFQLGITLSELLTRRHPFQGPNHYQTMKNIVDATYIPVLRVSRRMKALSTEVVEFLDSLLQRNPSRRLGTISPSTGHVDARSHPWFAQIDWNAALRGELNAGFLPNVASNIDVSNFDDVFTQETAELSGERDLNANIALNGAGGYENGGNIANGNGKNSNWMNLWGLLGDPTNGNNGSNKKNGGGGGLDGGTNGGGVNGGVDDGDEFADFDGFSFEEPSVAADQVMLEAINEEEGN
jgi:serine/threonine protein kinase